MFEVIKKFRGGLKGKIKTGVYYFEKKQNN